jgi:hypothetical protein
VSTAIKTLIYVLFVVAMYCEETDVPVMMYLKRWKFLLQWKLAAKLQTAALYSYTDYMEEAELTRG